MLVNSDISLNPKVFATSSADWTTKIWSKQNPNKPIFTIENSNNYVYSSKWNPINASLLATGDGDGYLDIMDFKPKVLGVNPSNIRKIIP